MQQQPAESGSPRSALSPSKGHPIYSHRKLLIIIASFGSIFFFLFSTDRFAHYFLLGSIIFALCDLLVYAQNSDENPVCPQAKFLLGDLAFAFVLQYCFWCSVMELTYRYPYYGYATDAWALLATGICSIIHAFSFWKQLVAWYRKRWQITFSKEPCERCGHVKRDIEESRDAPQSSNHASLFAPRSGMKSVCGQTHPLCRHAFESQQPVGLSVDIDSDSALTPTSQEIAMEEGLLVGSVLGSDYGAISEPIVEDVGTFVSKGKEKKRIARSERTQHMGK